MTDTPPVAELLAHGGWALLDPRPVAAANPDTFEMPAADQLARIEPGSLVRAMFATADLADVVRDKVGPYDEQGRPRLVGTIERMWLRVAEPVPAHGSSDDLLCHLGNQPLATHTRLAPGTEVRVPLSHLISLAPGTPEELAQSLDDQAQVFGLQPEGAAVVPLPADYPPHLHPDQAAACASAGVRPHRPWIFSHCLVARDLSDGAFPVHGGRFEPDAERGDNGWVVWAGFRALEEAVEQVGFDVVDFQEVHRLRPEVWRYLALPPGWGLTDGRDGAEAYPIDVSGRARPDATPAAAHQSRSLNQESVTWSVSQPSAL